ncbi:MAG TPA: L,D-transpeptidase [Anaerolineales bacterium]|nr:L,D-transpeptidase [Anaerolineales bacterium]
MTTTKPAYDYALRQAYQALRGGHKLSARRWAQQAAALRPDREEAWLILASVAAPEASVRYLETALAIDPTSPRARKGMHWAIRRLRAQGRPVPQPAARKPLAVTAPRPEDHLRRRSALLPWIGAAVFAVLIVLGWFASPLLAQALAAPRFAAVSINGLLQPSPIVAGAGGASEGSGETAVPLQTATAAPSETPAPSVTPLPSLTPLPTNTPTPTPTDTPTPTATNTPLPTNTPAPTNTPVPSAVRPSGVGANENWVDIDLTRQMLFAYTGDTLVRSFVVSTGTWQTPTVTGTYKVYVKYTYADMSGPGYYLANVPYVMYFYQGYGIHGTYWHNNFGTPMSHGCVNMTIDDSGWIFNFSVVGTVVNIHH